MSFEARMDALAMNLELTVHSVEKTEKVMAAMGSVIESHDRQIGLLIELARTHDARIEKLEGGK